MKNIVFMGTPEYASEILLALLREFKIVAIFTQPDKPVGRKAILTPPHVKKIASEFAPQIPIFQPVNLKEPQIEQIIREFAPEFIVVAAYGKILPENILNIAPCINLHASILPEFRGASPIQEAILSGKKMSGVTAMKMGAGLDDGDMLGFGVLDISNLDAEKLFINLAKIAANLIVKILKEYENIAPIKQCDALSSKCKKIKKEDGKISEFDIADDVWTKFKAYNPWPGIYFENGTKILDAQKVNSLGNCGEILQINADNFVLGFKDGALKIKTIQEAGKKAICARDFINGKRLKVGDKLY